MNKEQLKEALGELNLVDTVFEADGVSYIDTAVSVVQVYDLIDQLDEPEKVVIPKFVAEWIEELKQDGRPLYSVMSSLMNKTNHEWAVWKSANKSFSEIVAQAWLDGYKAEKEKLYYTVDEKGQTLLLKSEEGIIRSNGTDLEIVLNVYEHAPSNMYQLTEKEIKEYDERYWHFAVEVVE